MRIALKLNAIEQEHLQELYDAAGVARDELPYTPQFDQLCQDFQDRAFKNAEKEQVYGAMLKYVRSSSCTSKNDPQPLPPEQVKQLKLVLKKHGKAGKILPYSSEFEAAQKEFSSLTGKEWSESEFWQAITGVAGKSRRPPKPSSRRQHSSDDEAEEEGE